VKRNTPKVIHSLKRFMYGIFNYYHDKGMSLKASKIKMFHEVYDILIDIAKQEEDIPDHLLILSLQHASKMLNSRGVVLSNKLRETQDPQKQQKLRQLLREIKQIKDSIDEFTKNYRGD